MGNESLTYILGDRMNWYKISQLDGNEYRMDVIEQHLSESISNSKVLAHVAGPSGSGKTTLVNNFTKIFPNINFEDLDRFDDDAEKILGYDKIRKRQYNDQMLYKLYKKRQQLMDKYIKESDKPIVFAGHHLEDKYVLKIPTKNRFLLDVDAKTSAYRGWERSQTEDPKYRRRKEDLPKDIKAAEEDITWLKKQGYKTMSPDQIEQWIRENGETKKLFHLSNTDLDRKILIPRIPKNYMTKNGYEDNKIKRISFSETIDGALLGMSDNLKDKILYVYEPLDYSGLKIKPNIQVQKLVPDAFITREVWVLNKTQIKCIGQIKVIQPLEAIEYKYGLDKSATLYSWKWEIIDQHLTEDIKKL